MVDILFPDHLPEVVFSVAHWSLAGDEQTLRVSRLGLFVEIRADVVGVNVGLFP